MSTQISSQDNLLCRHARGETGAACSRWTTPRSSHSMPTGSGDSSRTTSNTASGACSPHAQTFPATCAAHWKSGDIGIASRQALTCASSSRTVPKTWTSRGPRRLPCSSAALTRGRNRRPAPTSSERQRFSACTFIAGGSTRSSGLSTWPSVVSIHATAAVSHVSAFINCCK